MPSNRIHLQSYFCGRPSQGINTSRKTSATGIAEGTASVLFVSSVTPVENVLRKLVLPYLFHRLWNFTQVKHGKSARLHRLQLFAHLRHATGALHQRVWVHAISADRSFHNNQTDCCPRVSKMKTY